MLNTFQNIFDVSNNKRVVASLTTMPDRYHKLPYVLKSLQAQTHQLDAIYLSLPTESKRLHISYPELPEAISSVCTVVRCIDYGPITKLVGALLSEQDPEVIIITFDDDVIYSPNLVAKLLSYNLIAPNVAIGTSGLLLKHIFPMCAVIIDGDAMWKRMFKFHVPPEGRSIDSIYGCSGALYLRKFFPPVDRLNDLLKYVSIDNNMFMNDDIVISGYLSLINIQRRLFPTETEGNTNTVTEVNTNTDNIVNISTEGTPNDISYDGYKFVQRLNSAIIKCKEIGMYAHTEPMDPSETLIGIVLVISISVILIILLSSLLYLYI